MTFLATFKTSNFFFIFCMKFLFLISWFLIPNFFIFFIRLLLIMFSFFISL